MRITSKGQVTIPSRIRRKAGLWPHTEVTFSLRKGAVILKKAGTGRERGQRVVVEAIRGKATARLSTDQIMALTRKG
ncbi:MAG TPA: AbrB/MazE/SpoVT family DNA-binding domain-containing protein [Methylomirabilota bacterium]|nr:AbrB/MazE/SpoVT family DNA-binding domain-containing protein [Methylomirabilota bacterium]